MRARIALLVIAILLAVPAAALGANGTVGADPGASCPVSTPTTDRIRLEGGDGNDSLTINFTVSATSVLNGGDANDFLFSSGGDDVLNGGPGDDVMEGDQ